MIFATVFVANHVICNVAKNSTVAIHYQKCVNGQEENGVCLCPDEWTGEFCQEQNFCDGSAVDGFHFNKTVIGRFSYSNEVCKVGTANEGIAMASVQCLDNCEKPCFGQVQKVDCDLTLKDLQNISANPVIVANNVQILTSQPQQLTAENITEAAEILNKLLESPPGEEVAVAAVTTVSQLLNANFAAAGSVASDTTDRLTASLERLSLNLEKNESLLVQPNLVIQSVRNLGETPGVEFVAQAGQSIQFVPNRINLNATATGLSNNNKVTPDVQMFLQLKPGRRNVSVGFVLYQNDQLFQSVKFKTPLGSTRQVISATMGSGQDLGLVEMRFRPIPNLTKFAAKPELYDFACVFWDYEMEDWSTKGCQKKRENSSLGCICNHTTNFAVLMSWNGHTYAKELTWISILGCSLSIAGVTLTIAFQILTRKSRKANATILMVGICSSLLAVYLLFLFGINTKVPPAETQNIILHTDEYPERDRGSCTAMTVLLQYFLLATFTWNTLYATQIFFLIHSTLAQQTHSFTIFALFVGWGFPASVVAVTLGVTYRPQHPLNYRQEKFCWLAAMDAEGELDGKKPMVWGFLIPVALMLLYNCVILVYFTLVTYRPNPMLKSTVKRSPKKKALSSLSLGVILGLSWILGYLLLSGTEKKNYILSVIFCALTSTQGLQIFIFFTVRTPAFRKMLSKLLLKIPAPEIYLHHKKFRLWKHFKSTSYESYRPTEDISDTQPCKLGPNGNEES
ncbi:hypothetical protein GJAV_G00220230 [Gymnothorax javanicus]|nr:hypothetical protein GJAV_G00220230 [Gymnothorax javanicus]